MSGVDPGQVIHGARGTPNSELRNSKETIKLNVETDSRCVFVSEVDIRISFGFRVSN